MPVRPPTIKKWKLERTTRVGDFGPFGVDRHALRDAEGNPRRDVYTFACADWCNVVALTDDDHVVLVWQYRFGTDAMSLEVPGGVVDAGESPADAAVRELLEETGYRATAPLELLLVVEPNPALQGNRCYTFVAPRVELAGATAFDENEELEVALVPRARLPETLDRGLVTHALVHSALEAFLRKRR